MATQFNWTCPYCQRPQIVTEANYHGEDWKISVGKITDGDVGLCLRAIGCLNADCRHLTLTGSLHKTQFVRAQGKWAFQETLHAWRLMPESSAKPQPEYIPEVLRVDYAEACRIRELSPKASATLARRVLQGMIRDFCGISKGTLDAEIKELRSRVEQEKAPRGVTPESVDGIDHVRKIGNIGAHMEKDINLIIEIDPKEAQILIELVETLFDEWYVARQLRADRFSGLAALGKAKAKAKAPDE